MIVDSLMELIGQTPVLRLNRYGEGAGAAILAKLEMFNPYSLKDRPAAYMIDDAEGSGKLQPGGTLIEASSGNAGIGLTYIGRLRGYHVVICMSELMSDEHKQLLRALGAELMLTPAELGIQGSREKAQELAESLPNSYYLEQHHNPANARSHYETTAKEIWNDLDGNIDFFIHGLGSCGTITGVARALKKRNPALHIIGIEPEGAALISEGKFKAHRLLGIGPGFIPRLYDSGLVDEIITVSEDQAFKACREVAGQEGLLIGITSGASAHVALTLARQPENAGKTICIIFSDAGQGYLSVEGLFS
jgi:cysteine synthase A